MEKQRTLIISDIHGGYRALLQVFERSKFNYENDILICNGDTADGWGDTYACIEELMKIKNLIYIEGNHDSWLKHWLKDSSKQPNIWVKQGGQNTIMSYKGHSAADKKRHLFFLKKAKYVYVDDQNRLFVHGGIKIHEEKGIWKVDQPLDTKDKMYLMWDRELWGNRHQMIDISPYKEIYVGHTSIWRFSHYPISYNNVSFMDTGAGWEGKLSILDIDTKKFWQSDLVAFLYPECLGRR